MHDKAGLIVTLAFVLDPEAESEIYNPGTAAKLVTKSAIVT